MHDDGSVSGQFGGLVEELKSGLLFLTRLPAPLIGADPLIRPDFTVAARMFPLVGAIIGLAGSVALILAFALAIPPLVGAALAVATTVVLTGALHEDGLADSADSFGGATREEKLAIMDDSRIGTYGALAVVIAIVLRIAALAAILPWGPIAAGLALIAGEALSRAAMVRLWHDLPAARTSGLSAETGPPDYNAMLVALAIAGGIVVVTALPALGWRATALAVVFCVLATYAAIRITANTLGGRTGDTLGACQQLALTAFLVGASAI